MKNILTAAARWLPAAAWYGAIWRFSAQTAAVSGALSDRLLYRLLDGWSEVFRSASEEGREAIVSFLSFYERKAAHMFLYFVLAGLLTLALPKWDAGRRGAAALGLCAVLAALDEFHQTFVPGRSGQVRDVLVDAAGAACFLLLWAVARALRERR